MITGSLGKVMNAVAKKQQERKKKKIKTKMANKK